MLKKGKLRKKLVILFVVVGLLPACLVSVILFSQIMSGERAEVFRVSEQFALEVSDELQALSQEVEETAGRFATDERNGVFWTIPLLQLADPGSLTWVNTLNSLQQYVGRMKDQVEYFYENLFVAIDGEIVYIDQGTTEEYGLAAQEGSEDFLGDAFTSTEVTWSPWIYSTAADKFVTFAMYPIQSADGSGGVDGVLALGLGEDKVEEILHAPSEEGKLARDVFLVDNSGLLQSGTLQASEQAEMMSTYIETRAVELINTAKTTSTLDEDEVLSDEYVSYNGQRVLGSVRLVPFAGQNLGLVVESDAGQAFQGVREGWLLAGATILATTIVVLVLSIYVTNAIVRPILKLVDATRQVASGDLSAEVVTDREDELGELANAFNSMRENLRKMIAAVEQVISSASTASEQLSATSEENSASVYQTAQSISELTENTKLVSSRTQEMAANSQNIKDLADQGKQQMQITEQAMANVVTTSGDSQEVMEELKTAAQRINQVVNLISEVADQTNLLALNAAIEAARAGESGRGFAVVADEVRKLAEQTQRSVGTIMENVQQLSEGTISAAQAIVRNNDQIVQSTETLVAARNDFENIAAQIESSVNMITEIAGSGQHLEAGMEQILDAVHAQSDAMQQVAASAESVSQMAGEMAELISQFRV